MIGDYKGTVKNKVITALLQAYLDVLDYDGMKSILKEAGMLQIKDERNVDPNQILDFFLFKKIISAQNCLLYKSNRLLYEIGRKLSIYLFPNGKDFVSCIEALNNLILTDWHVKIAEYSDHIIIIEVKNCIFCSEIGVPCDLFKGFLVNLLEKTLTAKKKVIYKGIKENIKDPNHNSFALTLIIRNRS